MTAGDVCGTFIFAGGGTGGHIYPGLAVAQKISQLKPDSGIIFLCSSRQIDSDILSKTGYEYKVIPAKGLAKRPDKLLSFMASQFKSYSIARQILKSHKNPVVIGAGGFVSAPVVYAAYRLGVPAAMLNVDIVPGKANQLMAKYVSQIFVQFAETQGRFKKMAERVSVTGCPLRMEFETPDKLCAVNELGLDPDKKTLLVTGASSGAASINRAVSKIMPLLGCFEDRWQVVHLTGKSQYEQVEARIPDLSIKYIVLDYYEGMHNLYAAADLIIGRAGAVSVAEYSSSGKPAICLPYPYHRDNHQALNAEAMVKAGAARIVQDNVTNPQATVDELKGLLFELMEPDSRKLARMTSSSANLAGSNSALEIAGKLICMLPD